MNRLIHPERIAEKMGIKRAKKRPSLVGIKSEDKRARLEAGLDLQLNTDLSDTTLEHIVKEVVAPKSEANFILISHLPLCSEWKQS